MVQGEKSNWQASRLFFMIRCYFFSWFLKGCNGWPWLTFTIEVKNWSQGWFRLWILKEYFKFNKTIHKLLAKMGVCKLVYLVFLWLGMVCVCSEVCLCQKHNWPKLVGGFNPLQKHESNWKSSPGRGENEKNTWNHHQVRFAGYLSSSNTEDQCQTEASDPNRWVWLGRIGTGRLGRCRNVQKMSPKTCPFPCSSAWWIGISVSWAIYGLFVY